MKNDKLSWDLDIYAIIARLKQVYFQSVAFLHKTDTMLCIYNFNHSMHFPHCTTDSNSHTRDRHREALLRMKCVIYGTMLQHTCHGLRDIQQLSLFLG